MLVSDALSTTLAPSPVRFPKQDMYVTSLLLDHVVNPTQPDPPAFP
jgi:hypothetical protein